MMFPLRTEPSTSMRSTAGTSWPQGARTLTVPLRARTSSMSTAMPGLVMIVRFPLPTSALRRTAGSVMTASVKSRVTLPLVTLTSSCLGTTHGPSRRALPLVTSIRTRSFGARAPSVPACAGATPAPGAAGRSAVSAASSA